MQPKKVNSRIVLSKCLESAAPEESTEEKRDVAVYFVRPVL